MLIFVLLFGSLATIQGFSDENRADFRFSWFWKIRLYINKYYALSKI